MTNGEKLKEIFPNGVLTSINNNYYWGDEILVSKNWWNAEYKEPSTKVNQDLTKNCSEIPTSSEKLSSGTRKNSQKLENVQNHGMGKKKSFDFIKKFVANLPSVTPQPKEITLEDVKGYCKPRLLTIITNELYYELTHFKIKTLEQEPKTGHWIAQNDDYYDWYECSECGYGSDGEMQYSSEYDVRTNYCPNCGADMREVEE